LLLFVFLEVDLSFFAFDYLATLMLTWPISTIRKESVPVRVHTETFRVFKLP